MALLLKQKGVTRVRPLAGGFDAWRERGYPMQTHAPSLKPDVTTIAT